MPAPCQVPDAKGDLSSFLPQHRWQEALSSFYKGRKELGFGHQQGLVWKRQGGPDEPQHGDIPGRPCWENPSLSLKVTDALYSSYKQDFGPGATRVASGPGSGHQAMSHPLALEPTAVRAWALAETPPLSPFGKRKQGDPDTAFQKV